MKRALLAAGSVLCFVIVASWWSVAQGTEGEPDWAVVSTEVDETLDNSGFHDRQGLQLFPPYFTWSGDLGDVWFDTGDILGVEAGLDAIHFETTNIGPGGEVFDEALPTVFFSLETDVTPADGTLSLLDPIELEDEDLLGWNPTWGLFEVFDGEDLLGADYGLDAITRSGDSWLLSTEVGGIARINPIIIIGSDATSAGLDLVPFSDGDVIEVEDDTVTGILAMSLFLGGNVGLDALHYEPDPDGSTLYFSTEVDGVIPSAGEAAVLSEFKDEDILGLTLSGLSSGIEVGWRGEEGFGRDVGLDALYVEIPDTFIPEPGVLMLASAGLGALAIRLRKRPG